MQPAIVIRESVIEWQQVLTGVTAANLFPTSLTAGVHFGPTAMANKVHVAVVADSTVGTSCTVALIGLTNANQLFAASTWVYLGSLNGGSSITPNTAKWTESGSTTRVVLVESFSVPAESYYRYSTVVVLGGTGTAVSTWVGISRP